MTNTDEHNFCDIIIFNNLNDNKNAKITTKFLLALG